jgi:hypothetical protein
VKLTLVGLCPFGLPASPSLLCFVILCTHATISTPLAARLPLMVHPSSLGAFADSDAVRLSRKSPHRILRGISSRGGNLLVMLRPACMLGLLSGPRRFTTGQPVYGRACPSEGLPSPKSAITSRLNHLLPRQDLHLLACQRTKAALRITYLLRIRL